MQTQHSTSRATSISDRIDQLLQRVASLTTADKLKPTKFNAAGQAHANRIAQRDQVPDSGTSTRNHR